MKSKLIGASCEYYEIVSRFHASIIHIMQTNGGEHLISEITSHLYGIYITFIYPCANQTYIMKLFRLSDDEFVESRIFGSLELVYPSENDFNTKLQSKRKDSQMQGPSN